MLVVGSCPSVDRKMACWSRNFSFLVWFSPLPPFFQSTLCPHRSVQPLTRTTTSRRRSTPGSNRRGRQTAFCFDTTFTGSFAVFLRIFLFSRRQRPRWPPWRALGSMARTGGAFPPSFTRRMVSRWASRGTAISSIDRGNSFVFILERCLAWQLGCRVRVAAT